MKKSELIKKLSEIDEDLEIYFQVDSDIFCGDYGWFIAESMSDPSIETLYYYDENIFDDLDEAREYCEERDLVLKDMKIKRVILIAVSN